jgi:hypothetical protein
MSESKRPQSGNVTLTNEYAEHVCVNYSEGDAAFINGGSGGGGGGWGRGKVAMCGTNDDSLCKNSTQKCICESCTDKNNEVMIDLSWDCVVH